jgi:myo-inositol-1-phosphate synthase
MIERTGVWLIGALGGVATTVALGARAIARKLSEEVGLVTARPEFRSAGFVAIDELVFGGCDVRAGSLAESAREIERANRSLHPDLIRALETELETIDARRTRGLACNAGRAIDRLTGTDSSERGGVGTQAPHAGALRAEIDRVRADLRKFRADHQLARVVAVNLASTEPPLAVGAELSTLAGLEQAIDADHTAVMRSSVLYAYAALAEGCGYVNFTPSNVALAPAIVEFAQARGLPFCGSDGKTGETLMKAALAPMFRDRNLRVLTWQGYNILGDRDGEILADRENLAAKVATKDRALASILGYPLHTHVGIDYVPSLHDLKTAWDFVHFEGFLGHRMALQFTWQGCDSILAAPLVLDLVRFTDLAMRRGEGGALVHLAPFFKSPVGCDDHDFHVQMRGLLDYVRKVAPGDRP